MGRETSSLRTPTLVGREVGPYAILAPLGAGAMGTVYRAHDQRLGRDVALKVLVEDRPDDGERRTRLAREARAAASLNHPGICTIHDVGEAGGQPFIVMELVDGQPLSARVAGRPLSTDDVVRFGVQLADALAHVHDRGLVHRDVKSANIMITPDGRAKLVDFGLARPAVVPCLDGTTEAASSRTRPGSTAGTVPYMAPEQLRGQLADARTDVWALGVVLYEMATGQRPFQGRTAFELSAAIFHDAPVVPSRVPAGLRRVIVRCLEKEPARRYQQASEVRASLEMIDVANRHPARPRLAVWRLAAGWAFAGQPWIAKNRT
jgi:serine/threonine protein kinase